MGRFLCILELERLATELGNLGKYVHGVSAVINFLIALSLAIDKDIQDYGSTMNTVQEPKPAKLAVSH